MIQLDETTFRLPLLIDTGALVISEYVVMDFNHRLVRIFDTLEEAEAFVAEANGTDAETVRRDTHERARMLDEPTSPARPSTPTWLRASRAMRCLRRSTASSHG